MTANCLAGYHIADIPKGESGELSKVYEEVMEAIDAKNQGIELMVLQELSDIIGAIDLYLLKNHPSLTLDDLIQMMKVTKRAFLNGYRTNE